MSAASVSAGSRPVDGCDDQRRAHGRGTNPRPLISPKTVVGPQRRHRPAAARSVPHSEHSERATPATARCSRRHRFLCAVKLLVAETGRTLQWRDGEVVPDALQIRVTPGRAMRRLTSVRDAGAGLSHRGGYAHTHSQQEDQDDGSLQTLPLPRVIRSPAHSHAPDCPLLDPARRHTQYNWPTTAWNRAVRFVRLETKAPEDAAWCVTPRHVWRPGPSGIITPDPLPPAGGESLCQQRIQQVGINFHRGSRMRRRGGRRAIRASSPD